jgi:uncharacterized membrane protein YphA (DoxX/SURF4 family)
VLDSIIVSVLRILLAGVLLEAAFHKLRDLPSFRVSLEAYGLVPTSGLRPVGVFLPLCEGVVGLALLASCIAPSFDTGTAPLLAAGLFALYTAAIAINLARGRRRIDCGCGAPGERQELSGSLVLRNIGLIGVALIAALPPLVRPFGFVDMFTLVAGSLALFALWQGASTLLVNAPRLSLLREDDT